MLTDRIQPAEYTSEFDGINGAFNDVIAPPAGSRSVFSCGVLLARTPTGVSSGVPCKGHVPEVDGPK